MSSISVTVTDPNRLRYLLAATLSIPAFAASLTWFYAPTFFTPEAAALGALAFVILLAALHKAPKGLTRAIAALGSLTAFGVSLYMYRFIVLGSLMAQNQERTSTILLVLAGIGLPFAAIVVLFRKKK